MARPPAETRINQIYREAARLFVEKGFAAASMSDIAEAVGITKAGLYHFVASKDELALNLITWAYDVYDRDVFIPAQGISDPLERLAFMVRAHLYNVAQHRGGDGNPVTVLLDDPAALNASHQQAIVRRKASYYAFLRATLAALKERGDLIDVDPTVAAFTLLGMILWVARWRRTDGRLPVDEIVGQMTRMALRAVLTSQALERSGVVALSSAQASARPTAPRRRRPTPAQGAAS